VKLFNSNREKRNIGAVTETEYSTGLLYLLKAFQKLRRLANIPVFALTFPSDVFLVALTRVSKYIW